MVKIKFAKLGEKKPKLKSLNHLYSIECHNQFKDDSKILFYRHLLKISETRLLICSVNSNENMDKKVPLFFFLTTT